MCPLTSFFLQILEELPVSSHVAHPSFSPHQERGRGKADRWENKLFKGGLQTLSTGKQKVNLTARESELRWNNMVSGEKRVSENKKKWKKKEPKSLTAAVDLWGLVNLGCEGCFIPDHGDNPASLTPFFYCQSSRWVYICGYGSSKCGSVLAALSRIEELDFGHAVGDVTPRAVFRW